MVMLEARRGRVTLVGAGPGDPELLTLKAVRCLQRADVVLYDNLATLEVLQWCRPDVRCIDVGKLPHGRSTAQSTIHELLADEALAGHEVVRLKGGDPFVFGRGGEEMMYLRELGITVEVVPGISSAIAGPAAAGVPVTHRGVATHFTVVTGYTATADADQMATTWQHLAAAGGTLVVLMGLTRLDALVDSLLRAGIPADRPACVVHAATTAHEQVLDATLATLPHVVAAAGFRNHTLLVIGDVVALRQPGFAESLAWLPN